MGIIPLAVSKNFPCTKALPHVEKVIDPTYSKVKKIAIIFFCILSVLPIIATVITLLLDGIYQVYHCLYPNLKIQRNNPPVVPIPQPLPPQPAAISKYSAPN